LLRQARAYDIVEFHFCAYASWMRRVPAEVRVVYSAHNVELDYALAGPSSRLRRLLARQIGTLEHRAVHASDLVVTCTEADGQRLAQLYGSLNQLAVVSNGFDEGDVWSMRCSREEMRAELGLQPEELVILFIGGRAAHNRRAVQFLEYELLPQLKGPARLLLAGECARPRCDGRVLSLGRVDKLSPLLEAADVAVNPIDSGSGSNVKLAEYLAAGLPVVTTTIGLRGYEAFAHVVTVAALDGFLEAVQVKQRPVDRRPEVTRLSWSALGRQLYDVYADLLAERVLSPPS
jgi:glycosyltransferase involved in cell wall biosynthesis